MRRSSRFGSAPESESLPPSQDSAMKEGLGINALLRSGSSLNLVPAAEIGSLHVDFNRYDFDSDCHRWDWTVADQVVTDARGRNLEIHATLSCTQGWANCGQGRNVPLG